MSFDNDSPLVPVDAKPDDPDLLMKEYIFTQYFTVASSDRAKFNTGLAAYIPYMLNDFGMYFYRADYSTSVEKDSVKFFVNFYLITALRFTDEKYKKTEQKVREVVDSLDPLQPYAKGLYSNYSSTLSFLQKAYRRDPKFHLDQLPEGDYSGPDKGLNWSLFSMFVHWWLIVPGVQTDFLGILYQIFAFDIAHQGWVPKYVHFFTIPANVCMTLCFLCQFVLSDKFSAPFELSVGFIFATILAASYALNGIMKKSAFWGISTAFAVYLLWMVACLWYHTFKTAGAPWYNPTTLPTNPLLLMYLASFIEAMSHIIVPQLPPYIVGVNHWYDTISFFFTGNKLFILASLVSAVTFSPLVSYISWPHLIGDMSIYTLLCLGYHSAFYDEYSRIVTKAELTGNPAMDRIPIRFKDLIHGMPGNSGTPHKKGYLQMLLRTLTGKKFD